MDKKTVLAFNAAYAAEPTKEEAQLINDLLAVWAKLEPAAKKHPALIKRGAFFGMAVQKAIAAGEVALPKSRSMTGAGKTEAPGA